LATANKENNNPNLTTAANKLKELRLRPFSRFIFSKEWISLSFALLYSYAIWL